MIYFYLRTARMSGNERPVILTSMVGKLLENIFRDKIYVHLESQGLIKRVSMTL